MISSSNSAYLDRQHRWRKSESGGMALALKLPCRFRDGGQFFCRAVSFIVRVSSEKEDGGENWTHWGPHERERAGKSATRTERRGWERDEGKGNASTRSPDREKSERAASERGREKSRWEETDKKEYAANVDKWPNDHGGLTRTLLSSGGP